MKITLKELKDLLEEFTLLQNSDKLFKEEYSDTPKDFVEWVIWYTNNWETNSIMTSKGYNGRNINN